MLFTKPPLGPKSFVATNYTSEQELKKENNEKYGTKHKIFSKLYGFENQTHHTVCHATLLLATVLSLAKTP